MFTGIIEALGNITGIEANGTNKTFFIQSPLSAELKIDQSLSHNGVCLTVEGVRGDIHQVTAVEETLSKTSMGSWKPGDVVNLERCLAMNGRLDGHIVQGHVDTTAICVDYQDLNGSWQYRFSLPAGFSHLMVEKGSICLNGISLTIFDVRMDAFSVAIIPFTYEHTSMKALVTGMAVNIEFDIIGKYVSNWVKPALDKLLP